MSKVHDLVPLDHGSSTNIRVIEILRCGEGESNSLIHCKFHVVVLEKAPAYTAISYQWGPADEGHPIILDGETFSVRNNLWQFLNEARSREESAFLWIDAVCIDQNHTKERNHQVAMMGDIYARAAHVVVWLGPETQITAKLWGAHNPESARAGRFPYQHKDEEAKRQALKELARNGYWRRLWILQEYLLAQEITIWCGTNNISGEHFRYLMGKHIHASPATKILEGRHARQFSSTKMSFSDLLAEYGYGLKCSDRRDGVYALLSLLDERERKELDIEPNYSLKPIELLRNLLPKLNRRYSTSATVNVCATLGLDFMGDEVQDVLKSIDDEVLRYNYTAHTERIRWQQRKKRLNVRQRTRRLRT